MNKRLMLITMTSAFMTASMTISPGSFAAAVPGWQDGITHGSVSGASSTPGNFSFELLKKRPVRAVFTYAAGGGADTYNLKKVSTPFKTTNIIAQARQLESAHGAGHSVMPVVVVYTAGGSSSADAVLIDLGQNADYPDNLWLRFYNLIRIAQESEKAKDSTHPVPATFVLNPDFLGEVHKSCQPQYCPVPYKTMTIPVVTAVKKAFAELQKDGFLDKAPEIPASLNANKANFSQYINTINWLLITFSPSAVFGWHDNIWAGDTKAHQWIHTASTEDGDSILKAHIQTEVDFLNSLKVYDNANPYLPDFLAFDKWERDSWDASLQGNGINNGYLYNAPAWTVYFDFIAGVSSALHDVPVMLFQIPGGHLQLTNDIDPRNDHASTAPNYILGDSNIQPELSNVKQYIISKRFTTPKVHYSIANSSVIDYLNTCPKSKDKTSCNNGVYSWKQNHLQQLQQANVFSVMWGGGSTTSVVGLSQDLDDNGWLYQKLKAAGQH